MVRDASLLICYGRYCFNMATWLSTSANQSLELMNAV